MNSDERQKDLAQVQDATHSQEIDRGDPPEIFRISAWMYLRTIFLLAWSAFRHPFHTTYIDMASGEAVHIRPGEETWE